MKNVEGEQKELIRTAVNEIAYYLRSFKFNEKDIRQKVTTFQLFEKFPEPLLKFPHWEVKQFCENSFESCVKYLNFHIIESIKPVRRMDDTSVAILENGWSMKKDNKKIKNFDSKCRKRKQEERKFNASTFFNNKFESFQWKLTALYFMCWYTFNKVDHLKHFGLNCDNFANCLDWEHGPQLKDVRANDSQEFHCATFSFCPDPCCPVKFVKDKKECKNNPCSSIKQKIHTVCTLPFTENIEFESMIRNHWNLSCDCYQKGFQWSAKYGICADINECVLAKNNCNQKTESCLNTIGSFRCVCKWGYIRDQRTSKCVRTKMIENLRNIIVNNTRTVEKVNKRNNMPISLVEIAYNLYKNISFKMF